MGWIRSHYPIWMGAWLSFPLNILVSFIIFEILFHVAAIIKNIFCVKNGVKLAHLSVATKFYNGLISLNEIWPSLPPKYFGKLSDIYQLNIVRLHLWKIGVCSSWGELRSHYHVFLGVWLHFPPKTLSTFHNFLISFVVGIISCEACSWWVEIYPEMSLICLVPGAISTKPSRANQMDFIPLTNSNMFGGSNLSKKIGWNYPSGALCLFRKGETLTTENSKLATNLLKMRNFVELF